MLDSYIITIYQILKVKIINFTKKIEIWTKKSIHDKNTACLEQKKCASPENFTPALMVMLETFRRSEL